MNIYTGLLFLHGHIADAGLAASLAADEPAKTDAGSRSPARRAAPSRPVRTPDHHGFLSHPRRPVMRLFQTLMFLGGRPMTAGHNDDIDEPFPQAYGNRVASERAFPRQRDRKRDHDRTASPESPRSCATC
jgi:hypothetical protein